METSESDSCGAGQRGCSSSSALPYRLWATLPCPGASVIHRCRRSTGVRTGRHTGGGAVCAADHVFQHLPIHWMWWPAIGGLAIGLGGLIFPQALGVGYDTIGALLQGSVTTKVILGVLLVKWFIWAVSLGSGTSGGVLAPLLMMGGALGGLEAMFLPNEGAGFWP